MYELNNINGATFIFSPFKDVETASLGVFLRAGSRFEKAQVRGIAHFLEHMLFKGSRKYSYKQIKREIEGRGGSLNGFTSQEITAYFAHFLKKNIESALDILLDMVFYPRFNPEDINKERNVILEEIKMYNDLPASRASMLLDKLLWENHPLGEEIVGHFDSVKRIGRKDFLGFKKDFYLPRNIVISCSGNLEKKYIEGMLKKRIALGDGKPAVYEAPAPLKGLKVTVENKKLEQAQLCAGFRSVSYFDKNKLAIELINVILGGNMSSRLFEELREKRALCYDISTEARKFKDSGAFVIQLGLDKTNINTALSRMLIELDKIKNKGVADEELGRAKDYFLGQIAMGLERPQGRMFYLAENYVTLGKILSFGEIKKEVESITGEQIKKLAREIFDFKNMRLACVGDIGKSEEEEIRKIAVKA